MKPKIGVTADFDTTLIPLRPREAGSYFVRKAYIDALEKAGGIPIILPYLENENSIQNLIANLDGILLTGGDFDIDPKLYGEKPHSRLGKLSRERTRFEMQVAQKAIRKQIPLLGICGGEQAINTLLGGTLYQDIRSQCPQSHSHETSQEGKRTYHTIGLSLGTELAQILGTSSLRVNSTHHQAIKKLGRGLRMNAVAKDGIIEGIESRWHPFLMGVQWHPELLIDQDRRHLKLFKAFVQAAKG